MSQTSAIREGISANIKRYMGVRTMPWILDNPSPPIIVVSPGDTTFDQGFGQVSWEQPFIVMAIVGRASERAAQDLLDQWREYPGPTSLKAAIESDPTLGGAAQQVQVTRISANYERLIGEQAYICFNAEVRVITPE